METSIKLLGKVYPGGGGWEHGSVRSDPRPIVLWSGTQPAKVLYYHRQSSDDGTVIQHILPVDEELKQALSHAVMVKDRLPKKVSAEDGNLLDLIDPLFIMTADLDGDGTEELVLARSLGGVQVHAAKDLKKALFKYAGASAAPRKASYKPMSSLKVQLPSREELFILFRRVEHEEFPSEAAAEKELAKHGLSDRYALVRVDARGIERVRLGGLAPKAGVFAVGAINRVGSRDVDELFALSAAEGKSYLSRHTPDGKIIDAPREAYVPLQNDARVWFVPQSQKAVLSSESLKSVYFVTPSKPSNWIRQIDLSELAGDRGTPVLLGVATGSTSAKAIVLVKEAVYAIDEERKYIKATDGTWGPKVEKAEPFYQLKAPSPQHGLVGVFPSKERGDEFLVVYTRKKQIRELSHEEILQAAQKFLEPSEIDALREDISPNLKHLGSRREKYLKEERERKRVTQAVTTVEEWKRFLPESYAAVEAMNQEVFYETVKSHLTIPLRRPVEPGDYLNEQEYWIWFKGLEVAAETSLTLVQRGLIARTFIVPGYLSFEMVDLAQPSVDYRSRGTDMGVSLWIIGSDPQGQDSPGFYFARTAGRQP